MRPAEVCGCVRYPRSARSASSLRMVAEDRLTKYRLCSAWEPTGTALVVNSFTTARRIACFLFSMVSALCPAECQLQYRERDLVVQVHATPGGRHPAVDPGDQTT